MDAQPDCPPAFDDVAGKELEINWRYWVPQPGGRKKQQMIWCQGTIVEVATSAENRLPIKIRRELQAPSSTRISGCALEVACRQQP